MYVPLEVLENALREKGYTTGHSPQSKPLAQMGGTVATRSIGRFSTLTAQSKIWSLVWKQYWLMAPSHALKRATPRGWPGTFVTSSSVTKVHFAISLK